MQQNVPANTQAVFHYLQRCAREMRTINMGAVAEAVGVGFAPAIIPCLNYIRDECRARGLPWLPAIVVSAGTWMPAAGFLPQGVVIGDNDFPTWWRGMVLQVFATDWDAIDLV